MECFVGSSIYYFILIVLGTILRARGRNLFIHTNLFIYNGTRFLFHHVFTPTYIIVSII